jgi:hypothetical protein
MYLFFSIAIDRGIIIGGVSEMWEIEARFCAKERKRGRVRLSRALDGKKRKKVGG